MITQKKLILALLYTSVERFINNTIYFTDCFKKIFRLHSLKFLVQSLTHVVGEEEGEGGRAREGGYKCFESLIWILIIWITQITHAKSRESIYQ